MKPKYKIIKALEEDSFSKSYLASVDDDEKKYVIKQIILKDMTEQEKKETLNEPIILKKLDHPNIIKFKEVFIQRKPVEALNIVTEYADGGDLKQKIIEQKNKPFTEPEILDYFTQICLALQYLHKNKIIHSDLNSSNVFLMKSGIVKLGSLSKGMKNNRAKAVKKMVKLPYYLSPEIISNKPYDEKCDIWALGILLYELLTFKIPFNAQSLPLLCIKINRGVYTPPSSEYSSEIRDLLKKCLTLKPEERPSIDELLKLPLIKNRINNKLDEVQYDQDLSKTMDKKYKDKKKEGKEKHHQEKTSKEPDTKENPKKIINDKNKISTFLKNKNGSTNISTPISLSKINFLMKRKDPNFQKDKKYKEDEIGKILDSRGYKDLLDDKSGNFDINKMSEEQYDQLRLLNILYKVANGQELDSDGDEEDDKEIIEQCKEEDNEIDKRKKDIEKEIGNDLLKEILGIMEKACDKNGINSDKELIKKNILELISKGFDKAKVEKAVDKIEEILEIFMKNKKNV